MSNDGQDDKNVNNEQTQLNDNNSNNKQDQKENTSSNHDTLTPEAVTSPSNANIADAQNSAQVKSTSDEVLGAEVTSSDPVEVNRKDNNNKQEQSSLGSNIGYTQDKEESINANTEATSKKEDEQAAKVNVEEKESIVQAGNTPNEVKEQVIANNVPTEPDKQDADSIDKDLKQLLSRIEKGEPEQKLEDAQVKNVLGAIKAQLTATANPAELARLASAAASLASSTNNPEILEQIKGIQAAIANKEETAEQIISSDIAADNLGAQESIEQTEQKAHIEKYAAIKDDFHKKLDEDLELLDAAIDPHRATPEQRRILEDDLTDAEREEIKRKAQLKKEGYEHVYNIKENAEKEIAQNNTKITGIDERLKATKDDNQRQSLEAERQQYIKANEVRQQELADHVKDELVKRDKEREKLVEFTKLKERVEKYPKFSKDKVREHFELHAAEYEKNPDRTAINELHAMVRKVGLEKELGVAPEPQEVVPIQAIPNINEKQEVLRQDLNKAINQVHDEYPGRPIPREATDKIANTIVHNEGYPHHIEIMKIEKIDKTVEQNLIKSIRPVPKLGYISPSNSPNKPTQGQDKKR
jgi:hypothetical protein